MKQQHEKKLLENQMKAAGSNLAKSTNASVTSDVKRPLVSRASSCKNAETAKTPM